MRQISLDTETTGLFCYDGHKIIEIGCIEIINKRITGKTFHAYINPDRKISLESKRITGITDDFLKKKPRFKDIMHIFLGFIKNAEEIIIHNANFDVNFINNELNLNNAKIKNIKKHFKIFDTLSFARRLHPGKKNNLDILCDRYNVDNRNRENHSALLDAKLLALVYLKMTFKQENFNFQNIKPLQKFKKEKPFQILKANENELNKHKNYTNRLKEIINNKI